MNARGSRGECARRTAAGLLLLGALSLPASVGCSYQGAPAYMMKNGVTATDGSSGRRSTGGAGATSAGTDARLAPINQAEAGRAGGGAGMATGSAGDSGGAGASGASGTAGAPAAESVAACLAHAGETVCDGANLYHCVDQGGADSQDTCASAARCRAGLTTGRCGICEPGDYRCSDATLESCSTIGEWHMEKRCASAELCTQGLRKHSCDPMACEAGSFDCSNGRLRTCKSDLTDFDLGTPCDAELCDNKAGRCNECQPSTATCDATKVISCSADGKKSAQTCSGTTALCQNGKCVECKSAADCKSSNACRPATCDTGSGTCGTGSTAPAHSTCTLALIARPGKCDYLGNCVPCVDDTDCVPSQQCNVVLGCRDRPPLQMSLSVFAGVYVVTVAPGYKASIVATTNIPSGTSVTVTTSTFRTACYLPNRTNSCTIPAATMAQTLTISGPSAQSCANFVGATEGFDLTLGFEDQTSDVEAATCDNPTLTISAIQ
jgi:hypothetical protein